jgi:hypothetical protein
LSVQTSCRSIALLERAAGLALFLGGEAGAEHGVVERWGVGGHGLAIGVAGVIARDAVSGVKPRPGEDERNVRRGVDVVAGEELVACGQCGEFLGVQLLDQGEAPEFALDAVEMAVVIGVS